VRNALELLGSLDAKPRIPPSVEQSSNLPLFNCLRPPDTLPMNRVDAKFGQYSQVGEVLATDREARIPQGAIRYAAPQLAAQAPARIDGAPEQPRCASAERGKRDVGAA